MFMVKILLLVSLSFTGFFSHGAEEGGGEKKVEKSEGKEGDKGGNNPEWLDLENKLSELSTKIKAKKENMEKLFEEKNKLPSDSPQVKPLIADIVRHHKELTALAEQYEKKQNLFLYRFPERGTKGVRHYDRIEIKSVEEMEDQMGLDGKLSRNVKKMRAKYGEEPKPKKQKQSSDEGKALKQDGSIDSEGSVLMKK